MRRAFADALVTAARRDPKVVFLTGDLGFGTFDAFEKEFGDRYLNVGIAEALLVDAAAGLAREGWRPIVYSIASFMTGRAFEQIRFAVGYEGLPVAVVGAGRGLTYSTSGISHHALDDVALMSSIPGVTVVTPGDPAEVSALLPQVLTLDGPSYFSVGKYGEPTYEALEAPALGKLRLLQRGHAVAVITLGEMASVALDAARRVEADGWRPAVYQVHTPKPLDVGAIHAIAGEFEHIIVVEEHLPQGGLHAAIAMSLAGSSHTASLFRLGPPDRFLVGNVERDRLRRRLGYDADSIAAQCRACSGVPSRELESIHE